MPLARRIAAHITLTLSHQRLAEQALLNKELRAQTTNLELLDELLVPLIDCGDLRGVFERISAIAGKVLAHDAVALLVPTPDGHHHHAYASRGFPATAPAVTEVRGSWSTTRSGTTTSSTMCRVWISATRVW